MARLFTLSESKYYLMALDAGTGRIRAVIFDLEGNQIAVGQAEWRHLRQLRRSPTAFCCSHRR
ncbi:hypothetical protein O5626_30775, partial [Escherichia coli]|nr:hypothetical protein [Escherichia coli]